MGCYNPFSNSLCDFFDDYSAPLVPFGKLHRFRGGNSYTLGYLYKKYKLYKNVRRTVHNSGLYAFIKIYQL